MATRVKLQQFFLVFAAAFLMISCGFDSSTDDVGGAGTASATFEQDKDLAREAFIFAYPMLENYRALQAYVAFDMSNGNAPYNRFAHATHLSGPDDTLVIRPNNDTLYSRAILDLRAEPVVIHVPAMPERYYSIQLIDLYTHNFGYIGTRATGTEAGSYLVAGPDWQATASDEFGEVFRSECRFVFCLVRIGVAGPADVPDVSDLQQQFEIEPLSAYYGEPAPAQPPELTFPPYDRDTALSAGFITYLNLLLAQISIHPSETALMERFSAMGIGSNLPYTPSYRDAGYNAGIEEALAQIRNFGSAPGEFINGWRLTGRIFGDREALQNDYLLRAYAAMYGLYGLDLEEAYYPSAAYSGDGAPLNGAASRYVLHFSASELPPVDGFWSLTMYNVLGFLAANPIERYAIGERTEGLHYEADGSLSIYLQKDDPGGDLSANWLPAPDGPFSVSLRMYLPAPGALDPLYAPPAIQKD